MRNFILGFLLAMLAISAQTINAQEIRVLKDKPGMNLPAAVFHGGDAAMTAKIAAAQETPANVNAFLILPQKILVDAGVGASGELLNALAKQKIAPAEITAVLLTHAHFDHIGGLITATGQATFPHAEIYLTQAELDYWLDVVDEKKQANRALFKQVIGGLITATGQATFPHAEIYLTQAELDYWLGVVDEKKQANRALFKQVLAAYKYETPESKIKIISPDSTVFPEIFAHNASGHTPGHVILETPKCWLIGDLIHSATWQVTHPEVYAEFDVDAEKANARRREFYEKISASGKPIYGAHLLESGVGKIISTDNGYKFIPEKE